MARVGRGARRALTNKGSRAPSINEGLLIITGQEIKAMQHQATVE